MRANDAEFSMSVDIPYVDSLVDDFNNIELPNINIPDPDSDTADIGEEGTITTFDEDDFKHGSKNVNTSFLENAPLTGAFQNGFAGWSEGGHLEAGAHVSLAGGASGVTECFIDKEFQGDEIKNTTVSVDGEYSTAFWLLFGNARLKVELFCREKTDSGWVYESRKEIHVREHDVKEMAEGVVENPLSEIDKLNPVGEKRSGSLDGSEISADISPGERYQIGVRAKCVSAAFGIKTGFIPNVAATSMISTDTNLDESGDGLKEHYDTKEDIPLLKGSRGKVTIDHLNISWNS